MARIGQIEHYGEWFDLGKYGGTGVPIFLGQMKGGKGVPEIFLGYNGGVELHFLEAEKVGRYLLHKLIKSVFSAGTQPVNVPGDKGVGGILGGH